MRAEQHQVGFFLLDQFMQRGREVIADEDARFNFSRNPRLQLIQILGRFGLIARHELIGQLDILAAGRCPPGHGGLLDEVR